MNAIVRIQRRRLEASGLFGESLEVVQVADAAYGLRLNEKGVQKVWRPLVAEGMSKETAELVACLVNGIQDSHREMVRLEEELAQAKKLLARRGRQGRLVA